MQLPLPPHLLPSPHQLTIVPVNPIALSCAARERWLENPVVMCLVMACVTLSVPTKRVCRMRSTVDQCSPPVLSGKVRWGSRTDWVRRMPRACVKMAQLMSHSVVPCEHRCTSCCSLPCVVFAHTVCTDPEITSVMRHATLSPVDLMEGTAPAPKPL